jgi:hypothetical protein
MKSVQNGLNDVMRDAYNEIIIRLEKENLLTEDIKTLITKMIDEVKTNKKIAKSTHRISGYHLYMREHRKVIKEEQPDITPQEMTSVLAKAWKDVSPEMKDDYNARAKKQNESKHTFDSDTNTSSSDSDSNEIMDTVNNSSTEYITKKDDKKPVKRTKKTSNKKTAEQD